MKTRWVLLPAIGSLVCGLTASAQTVASWRGPSQLEAWVKGKDPRTVISDPRGIMLLVSGELRPNAIHSPRLDVRVQSGTRIRLEYTANLTTPAPVLLAGFLYDGMHPDAAARCVTRVPIQRAGAAAIEVRLNEAPCFKAGSTLQYVAISPGSDDPAVRGTFLITTVEILR